MFRPLLPEKRVTVCVLITYFTPVFPKLKLKGYGNCGFNFLVGRVSVLAVTQAVQSQTNEHGILANVALPIF